MLLVKDLQVGNCNKSIDIELKGSDKESSCII